jgi:hypothetical protein
MDKTLMRPLFRKKAIQYRQVEGKAVPKFFVWRNYECSKHG